MEEKKIKQWYQIIATCAALLVIMYGIGAFVAMDIDPNNWQLKGRVALVGVYCVGCGIILLAIKFPDA